MFQKRIGTAPVLDNRGILTGLGKISDILEIFISNYFGLIENLSFVHIFGAPEDFLPKDILETGKVVIETLMEPPISIEESGTILRAVAKMTRHDMIDLSAVDSQGKLAGLPSPVDVGIALLQKWMGVKGFS